ncbi:type II toxin-antitoxin system RelE/ParE family toxin [Alsobacter sp. KACC 23698]|uniref:Type II toxin-antitoxin system RelE/ParE family toxin n=1 Tax=Alsobacter sp. KACC 23698 TaxID=3149229 RepID=A0AAU7JAJ5_9HYPH
MEIYDRSVAEEIDAWPLDLRSRLLHIVDRIEAHGLDRVGMPLVRHLRGKLWEMRPSGKRLEGRALYVAVEGRRIVILVAFIKKRQTTPGRMIELAEARMKELSR